MSRIENRWLNSPTRRSAFRALAGFFAGSPFLRSQRDPFRDHSRVPSMQELVTAFDFEAVAHARLPREAYDYTAQGVESEFTLRRNREAFDWVGIVSRGIGGGASPIQTATGILDLPLKFPIMIAPTAGQEQLHPQGEIAMYQGGTAASDTIMVVSNNSSYPFDKIAAAAKGTLWFQLYPRQQPEANRAIVESAQAAGARAIVITVDQQTAFYERQSHYRHLRPAVTRTSQRGQSASPSNPYRISDIRLWYDWTLIEQLRPFIKVPLLIKGVVTAEDAKLAIEHGLNGIVVSNHGGRSLDYGPSTLEVLPEITAAVKRRIPVLIDSGFRRGSDVFKALALGANAVCLGRVTRWGLSAYGAPGVQRVLEILQSELTATMAQAGRSTIASIDSTAVRTDFP